MWQRSRFLHSAVLACFVAALLFGSRHATVQAAPNPPPITGDGEIAPGPNAAWDTPGDEADTPPASTTRSSIAAASDCLGWPTRRIRYTSDGVVHLDGCGQTFTLSEVAASPAVGPTRLQLVDAANKIWQLNVKLKVEEGATLRVVGGANGDANWLRLRSEASGGIWLRAERGNLLFQDTKVTSWDARANDVDRDAAVAADGSGGRAYIAARSVLSAGRATAPPTACETNGGTQEPYESRMDVINSEMSYLGYNAAESYGITWKVYYKSDPAITNDAPPPGRQLYALVDVFGRIEDSRFLNNYFGSYTFGGYCMDWSRNLFADNIQYGLDPHDDSDYVTIRENIFRDNGNHGVICSIECNNIVIVNNLSIRNQHGIMIHRNVNGALIEGNTSADNRGAGIAIFDSRDAVVRNNTVTNNGEAAIRLSVGASRNLIEGNTLVGASSAAGGGYIVYTYKGSDLPTSGDGVVKDNTFRNNTMRGTKQPIWKLTDTANTRFENNTLESANPQVELRAAPGTVVRDLVATAPIAVKLNGGDLRVEESNGRVWQTSPEADSTASNAGTALQINAAATLTPRELQVRPATGTVAARVVAWSSTTREWKLRADNTGGMVAQEVGELSANSCYSVFANTQPLLTAQANAEGRIAFSAQLAANSETAFRATPANCAGAAPQPTPTTGTTPPYRALVPMVRR